MKTVTIKYGVERMVKQLPDGFTIGEVKSDPGIRGGLGFSDNVAVLECGTALPDNAVIRDGATYSVEVKANTKASLQIVIIRYGVERMEKQYEVPVTVGDLRRDGSIKAGLGFGDNVNFLVNGVAQGDSFIVPNGAVVSVEVKANTKAALLAFIGFLLNPLSA